LSPETPEIRSAVVGATVTAIAMIAYQVAAKATRDAFFLSTFHVTRASGDDDRDPRSSRSRSPTSLPAR